MGIHITYGGSLDDPALLDAALGMVREFCQKIGWQCTEHSEAISGVVMADAADWESKSSQQAEPKNQEPEEEEPWPEEAKGHTMIRLSRKHPSKLIEDTIRGIYVQIPDSHPLGLLFNSQGRLRYYQSVPAQFILNAVQGAVHYMIYPMGITTLGVEPHVGVCAVLKMLKAKFMANLEVKDSTRLATSMR